MLELIQRAILGDRHRDYGRTMKVRNFSMAVTTGEGQEDWITRYRPKETKAQKAQRARLFNTPTKAVISRPRKYFKKIGNVQGINITIDSNDERISNVLANVEIFAGHQNLQNWLCDKLEYKGVTDPNAWIFYDRTDVRGTDSQIVATKIKPIIVPCENVVFYKNGDYFLFRELRIITIEKDGVKQSIALEDFFHVGVGEVTNCIEYETKEKMLLALQSSPTLSELEVVMPTKKTRYYTVETVQNGSTELLAMPVGAYKDENTDQRTFVSWFDPAEHVLMDLVRDKMLSDVDKIAHAFRKRYEYVRPCTHQDQKLGRCVRGFYGDVQDEAHRCKSCGGAGKVNFTSEQDLIQLAMPQQKDGMVELDKLYHEEPINTGFSELLLREIKESEKRVLDCIVNGGIVEKATGKETATATNYAYTDLYDLMAPYEQTISLHFEMAVRAMGQYMEVALDKVDHRFPKDKRMKPLSELYAELQQAKAAGAGYDAMRVIQEQIIWKLGEDNPNEVRRILARYDWYPFSDKSEEVVAMILAARSPMDSERILYENWLQIFSEIEAENMTTRFEDMTYEKQKNVVYKKVEQVAAKIILIEDGGADPIIAG